MRRSNRLRPKEESGEGLRVGKGDCFSVEASHGGLGVRYVGGYVSIQGDPSIRQRVG
ncbi:MAG TPA: hypothetical protein VIK11_01975 [Tepidiformaceae bacterium]